MTRLKQWIAWRYRHHFVFKCIHPRGCEFCSWCGFGHYRSKYWAGHR